MSDFRARKAGDALKLQRKLEEKYDEEDGAGVPNRIIEWIALVVGEEHPQLKPPEGRKGIPWRQLNTFLRDGVALCKLVNKLLKKEGKSTIKFNPNAFTAFVAMENIDTFNRGMETYGVDKAYTFNSIDLYEAQKGSMLNVINGISQLGFAANRKGFEPRYEGVEAPTRDAENWDIDDN